MQHHRTLSQLRAQGTAGDLHRRNRQCRAARPGIDVVHQVGEAQLQPPAQGGHVLVDRQHPAGRSAGTSSACTTRGTAATSASTAPRAGPVSDRVPLDPAHHDELDRT